MLENILAKNGRALLGIAFSFLLSNASLEAVRACVHWTSGEDQILEEGVKRYGTSNFATIAKQLPGRTGNQCRQRWNRILILRTLNPNPNRGRPWTEEEDQILIDARRRGARWITIAARLRCRTPEQCRNRFVSLTTRQQRAAARLLAPSPAPAVVQAEVPAGGAATGELFAPRDVQAGVPVGDGYGDPDAVDGEDDQQAEAYLTPEMEEDEDESESEEDGYGDPNAVDGEDDHCHLEFQHFVQCSISPTRTDDE
ncbi:MAG: hypothetical protein LBJ13_00865 [Puniceicoccales bacterium]|jgi:hypothetical protein|nr:hypothetical protein [Puniceicoccales bacterium]